MSNNNNKDSLGSPLAGEEYELPSISGITSPASAAGPSSSHHHRQSSLGGRRTLTLHTGASTSALVYNAPNLHGLSSPTDQKPAFSLNAHRRRSSSYSNKYPGRAQQTGFTEDDKSDHPSTPKVRQATLFLHEDSQSNLYSNQQGGTGGHSHSNLVQEETVQIPDFGGLLGLGEVEDNYAIAQGMKTDWKRRLFLLMEEPGSSAEAFTIHVGSTSCILFRWVDMTAISVYLNAFPILGKPPQATLVDADSNAIFMQMIAPS